MQVFFIYFLSYFIWIYGIKYLSLFQPINITIMTKLQKQIATLLEELVGQRFNEETLNHRLTDILQWEIKVEDISDKEDELVDYNFVFGFGDVNSDDDSELYGYGDIYFLKMRNEGFDGATFYVTEVNVDFE